MGKRIEACPGVWRETLAVGEKLMVVRFTFAPGGKVPVHRHPYEQSSYVAAGRLRYTVAGATEILNPGESRVIPGDVEHGAEALEEATAIDSFTPVRPDYLD